jgi:hypothetical protein
VLSRGLQRFLDAASVGGSDALVDCEGLAEVCGAFGGVAVVEVAAADGFQGARFLKWCAYVVGDGQRLRVVVTGLVTGEGLA